MAATIVAKVNLDFLLQLLNGQSLTSFTPTSGTVHKDAVFQFAEVKVEAGVHTLYITYTSQTASAPSGFITPKSTNGSWHLDPSGKV